MSNIVGQTLGLQLPGTLVFDYPSVSSMAQYIHSLLEPKNAQITQLSHDIVASKIASSMNSSTDMVVSLTSAANLPQGLAPTDYYFGGDAISAVPFGRWDLEALRVRCFFDTFCIVDTKYIQ